MSEHTDGKLIRRPDAGQWNVSTDECGMSCYESIQDDGGTTIGFVVAHKAGFDQEPSTEANARRIVAAWNYCNEHSTEYLEKATAASDTAGKTLMADFQRDVDRLSAINAELMNALIESKRLLVNDSPYCSLDAKRCALDVIESAISKAEST